jgi:hypothetical protein
MQQQWHLLELLLLPSLLPWLLVTCAAIAAAAAAAAVSGASATPSWRVKAPGL